MLSRDVHKASQILKSGGLVAMPTETVYGLGADATNSTAIGRIFQVKKRPLSNPLIVHIAYPAELWHWAEEISKEALQLAKCFWPGPLTLILKKKPHVLDIVTGKQETIGLRIPNHPVALSLLKTFGGGIAAPSANEFTHVSPTTSIAVRDELGDQIELILEGGPCQVGLESTILDMSGKTPTILRPGMISQFDLEKIIDQPVLTRLNKSHPLAPGQHYLHYAPLTKTQLVAVENVSTVIGEHLNRSPARTCAVIAATPVLSLGTRVEWVQMPNDAPAYAQKIYQALRELDKKNHQVIIIADVPKGTGWEAIRDRLTKATACTVD